MKDTAHVWTDEEIKEMQKHLRQIYSAAMIEISADYASFVRRIKKEAERLLKKIDEAKTETAKNAAKTAYKRLFIKAIKEDKEYRKAEELAETRLFIANIEASEYINKRMPKIYAFNYNQFGKNLELEIEDYRFHLASEKDVREVGNTEQQTVDEKKDKDWNKKILRAALLAGATLLLTPEKAVKRTVQVTAQRNYGTAARQASDLATGAENKGRMDSMQRANDEGFHVKKIWKATLDNRTRETHQEYDGVEPVELDYEYAPGLKRPKDPDCPDLSEVCNCRCRLLYNTGRARSETRAARAGEVTGSYKIPSSFAGTKTYYVRNMSYREWMQWRSK